MGGGGVGMETHLSTIIIDPTCISRRGEGSLKLISLRSMYMHTEGGCRGQ